MRERVYIAEDLEHTKEELWARLLVVQELGHVTRELSHVMVM
jgi:hypothetical protein